ncbi:MAG: signal peptidase I [Gemmatimonadales bacterium]|nr:MAG: signal peptidase I [Gemmatimonadales bacterium]
MREPGIVARRERGRGRQRSGRGEGRRRGGRQEGQKGEGAGSAWGEWIRTIVITIVLLVIIRTFLVQTFVITSGSMEDTLKVGDFLMVNRLALGTELPLVPWRTPGYSEARLGDVVVFDPAHEDDLMLVKRIVGMPMDTLEMRGKELYRNGERQNEPFVIWSDFAGDHEHPMMEWQRDHLAPGVDPDTYRPTRDEWGPLVVPEDNFFMLGDNRDASLDSRYWGLIEDWRLTGRAMFFYYSYDRDSATPMAFVREARWERIGRRIR